MLIVLRAWRHACLALAAAMLTLTLGACRSGERGDEPLRVAAAADLQFAFEEVGALYEKKTGRKVVFSFGSTGLLAKQLREGAPFDVFAAANVSFVDDVVADGACLGETKTLYARGRIVLFAPKDRPLPASLSASELAGAKTIAIANPEHAPYGRAAKQALTQAGVWPAVQPKIVYGENVQQTLQYARSGNADLAIVALSLATVSEGRYVPIDAALHDPLDQALVVCKGKGGRGVAAARAFTTLVAAEEGRAIMRRYGFLLPSEKLETQK